MLAQGHNVHYTHHYFYQQTQRCAKLSSHYIFNLRVTFEQQALIELQEYISNFNDTPYDYMAAAQLYMSDIFRELNIELDQYGIHIRPDYGQLLLENFPIEIDKSRCHSDTVCIERTQVCRDYFDLTAVHGVGNRLIIFYCDSIFSENSILANIENVKDCGHVLGIMYHDPDLMKATIKDEVIKMFTGGNRSSDLSLVDVNIELCKYAHSCVSEIGTLIGELLNNMKNIKDISSANYLMPVDSRFRMHGAFDHVSFSGPYHGHKRMYPLDDYCKTDLQYLNIRQN